MSDEVGSIEAPDEQSRRQRREKLSAFYGNSQGTAPAMGIQEKPLCPTYMLENVGRGVLFYVFGFTNQANIEKFLDVGRVQQPSPTASTSSSTVMADGTGGERKVSGASSNPFDMNGTSFDSETYMSRYAIVSNKQYSI